MNIFFIDYEGKFAYSLNEVFLDNQPSSSHLNFPSSEWIPQIDRWDSFVSTL